MELDKLITVIKSYRVAVREEKNPDVLSQIMVEDLNEVQPNE